MTSRPAPAAYEVVTVDDVPASAMIGLLRASFGPSKTEDHYTWKHVEGPWGPSRGWVAVDGDTVLGARLVVPWRLRYGNDTYAASRAMDGAVTPAARGRGVFTRLVRREMDRLADAGFWHVLYSTSVPASREAYRRVGWSIFDARPTALTPFLPRHPARVTEIDPAAVRPSPAPGQVGTAWDTTSMRWRTDPRSGHGYGAMQLKSSDTEAQILFRRSSWEGLPLLVATAVTGEPRERAALVGAACTRERCVGVLTPALRRMPRVGRSVGSGSTVSLWQQAGPDAPLDARDAARWDLTGADLEGVL